MDESAKHDTLYLIAAKIIKPEDGPHPVYAFNCCALVDRLLSEFPEVELDPMDYARRDYEAFLKMGLSEDNDAVQIALRDSQRRGPVWLFRLPVAENQFARGKMDRYGFGVSMDTAFPEPLRSRLIAFVEGLQFAPCVKVESVRLIGNDSSPA